MEDPTRTWPSESTKEGIYELTGNEAASTGLTWLYARSSMYVLQLLAQYFYGTTVYAWGSDSCLLHGLFSSCCVAIDNFNTEAFASSCFISSCLLVIYWKPVFFLMRGGGGGTGRSREKENYIARIYYMRKESSLNKRKKILYAGIHMYISIHICDTIIQNYSEYKKYSPYSGH